MATGFHGRWNSALQRRHPSLWVFLRRLKDEQRMGELTTAAADLGEARAPPKRKWRRLEERIARLKLQYNNQGRTLTRYWDAISHVVHSFA